MDSSGQNVHTAAGMFQSLYVLAKIKMRPTPFVHSGKAKKVN
jgi:hypothetical protein